MRDATTMQTNVRVHGVLNILMRLLITRLYKNIGVRETEEAGGSKRSVPCLWSAGHVWAGGIG